MMPNGEVSLSKSVGEDGSVMAPSRVRLIVEYPDGRDGFTLTVTDQLWHATVETRQHAPEEFVLRHDGPISPWNKPETDITINLDRLRSWTVEVDSARLEPAVGRAP